MTQETLNEVLKEHLAWIRREPCGKRADLREVDLRGLNLGGACLSGAFLSKADLSYADLRRADLSYADLRRADLSYADLRRANLRGADLSYADLSSTFLFDTDLSYADLISVDFTGSFLSGADLRHADLTGADLSYADLRNTDLRDTCLKEANLRNADIRDALGISSTVLSKYFPIACPEIGEFIGWKKVKYDWIVKLKITENAKRSSAFERKCRCSEALVLAIENLDGTPADVEEVQSKFDPLFTYRVGEIVKVPDFDDDRTNECAPGIHFFITRQEAVDY